SGRRVRRPSSAEALKGLSNRRRTLLELHYAGKISQDGFKEEEDRLNLQIETARGQAAEELNAANVANDLEERFEAVVKILSNLDISAVWEAAEDSERRVLVEELVQWITIFPDHLEVNVTGAPTLNVNYAEVGMKGSENVGVGDPTSTIRLEVPALERRGARLLELGRKGWSLRGGNWERGDI
ncbi:MAG: hypothetical protein ACRDVC_01390, partial [Acidimicrobiales bacterium]